MEGYNPVINIMKRGQVTATSQCVIRPVETDIKSIIGLPDDKIKS